MEINKIITNVKSKYLNVIDEIKMETELNEPIITTSTIIYNQIMFVAASKDKYAKFNVTNNPNDIIRYVYLTFPFTMEYN